jgi:hypothetical protein
MNVKDKLLIRKNIYKNSGRKPFDWLYHNNRQFNKFLRYYRNLFYTKYWWKDRIDFDMISLSENKFVLDYSNDNLLKSLVKRSFKEKIIDLLVDIKHFVTSSEKWN